MLPRPSECTDRQMKGVALRYAVAGLFGELLECGFINDTPVIEAAKALVRQVDIATERMVMEGR